MRIKLKVIANSKENNIKNLGDLYKVHLKEKAEKGNANKSLIELLAEHFNNARKSKISGDLKIRNFHVKKSQIKILSGMTSNIKIIELAD